MIFLKQHLNIIINSSCIFSKILIKGVGITLLASFSRSSHQNKNKKKLCDISICIRALQAKQGDSIFFSFNIST